jgi:hypothetical protein
VAQLSSATGVRTYTWDDLRWWQICRKHCRVCCEALVSNRNAVMRKYSHACIYSELYEQEVFFSQVISQCSTMSMWREILYCWHLSGGGKVYIILHKWTTAFSAVWLLIMLRHVASSLIGHCYPKLWLVTNCTVSLVFSESPTKSCSSNNHESITTVWRPLSPS